MGQTERKPIAAFVISLLTGIFIIIWALIITLFGVLLLFIIPYPLGVFITAIGIIGLLFGGLAFSGSILIYSADTSKVTKGGIIILLVSFFSLLFNLNVFAFILGLVGGILALLWNPKIT